MKRNPLKTRNVKKKDKNNPRKIFMTTSKINIQTTSNNEHKSSKCLMNKVNHASTFNDNNIDNDINKDKNNNNDHDNDQCNTSINSIHQPI